MDREIDIKYLFFEIIHGWKQLIIAGIIGALLLGGFNQLRSNNNIVQGVVAEKADYCTYGVLRVITESATESEYLAAIKDYSTENRSIMVSDEVLDQVIDEVFGGDDKVSAEQLRDSIYFGIGQYGEIITVNVITDNQELSTLICEKLLNHAGDELSEYGKDVAVLQNATVRGPVTVEKYENPANPRDTADIIRDTTVAEESSVQVNAAEAGSGIRTSGLMKWVIFGAVLGVALWAIVLCIKFIAQGYVKYPEQLDGISPLLNGESMSQTYMNVFLNGQGRQTVYFHSPRLQDASGLVYDLAESGEAVGEKTLVIEFTHGDETNAESDKGNVMKLNELLSFNKEKMEELLAGLKKEYMRILIYYDDSCQLSAGIAAGAYADGTITVVQKGKLKEREICAAIQQIQAADMSFLGSVFINYAK